MVNGREEDIAASDLKVGDVIRIRPGDNIGGDGVITSGQGSVNQASITGESLPWTKPLGIRCCRHHQSERCPGGAGDQGGTGHHDRTRPGTHPWRGEDEAPFIRIIDQYMHGYYTLVLVIGALVWAFTKDLNR